MKLLLAATAAAAVLSLSACGEREAEVAREGEGIVAEGEGVREGGVLAEGEGEGVVAEGEAIAGEGERAVEGAVGEAE